MKAKEAEQLTGLSKQTLIWYEKEGLIHPERNENRYREYSDQDVKTLQLIKLLRNMDISIDISARSSMDICQWKRFLNIRKPIYNRKNPK